MQAAQELTKTNWTSCLFWHLGWQSLSDAFSPSCLIFSHGTYTYSISSSLRLKAFSCRKLSVSIKALLSRASVFMILVSSQILAPRLSYIRSKKLSVADIHLKIPLMVLRYVVSNVQCNCIKGVSHVSLIYLESWYQLCTNMRKAEVLYLHIWVLHFCAE